MKTKTKSTAKKQYGKSQSQRSHGPRKRVEDRGLNEDEQGKVTNTREEEYSEENERFQRTPLDDVDSEEERERKRKVEDARGEEEN